jgi:twitching motility protein PilT
MIGIGASAVSLVESLLGAIVRLDGDALVMHVGEKPYVVTTSSSLDAFRGPLAWGQVELATKRLTLEAVSGMLLQLLPESERAALAELGAIEYEMPPSASTPGRFTVIAARGGDDIWLEVRYHRPPAPEVIFEPAAPAEAAAPAEVVADETPPVEEPAPAVAEVAPPAAAEPPVAPPEVVALVLVEAPAVTLPAVVAAAPEPAEVAPPLAAAEPEAAAVTEPPPEFLTAVEPQEPAAPEPATLAQPEPVAPELPVEAPVVDVPIAAQPAIAAAPVEIELAIEPEPVAATPPAPVAAVEPVAEAVDESGAIEITTLEIPELAEAAAELGIEMPRSAVAPRAELRPAAPASTAPAEEPAAEEVYDLSATLDAGGAELEVVALDEVAEPPTAVVVPLARPSVRAEAPPPPVTPPSTLDRLLRVAAARGASALYIVAQAAPVLRVDGEIAVLDGEEPLSAADVSGMLMEFAPEPTREALINGEVTEWMCDVADLGRVRCMSFRDHRGPGGIFRMLPAQALSAEQLGLSPAIQALSRESEGLVLVAGPRASGKSTLISAFVDLVNRTRADHVITLENQIVFVHRSRRSFVSQRELRGTGDALVQAARAALREDPDVLVIEDLHAPELVSVALEAAESGRLVFGAVPAAGATAALEKLIDQFPPERRAQIQTAIAGALRAVVAQVLVRKIGGGRVAARELLLNSRAVAAIVAEGKTFQLPHALDSGRKHGMAPLNDTLVALVRSSAIDPSEAYRKTNDREGLLTQLRREGVDTSFVERLA